MKNKKIDKVKSILPIQLLALVFIIILVMISIIELITFQSFKNTLIDGLAQRAMDHARLISVNFEISYETFNEIKNMPIEESRIHPETIKFKELVKNTAQLEGIEYVYIISKIPDDEVRFYYDDPELAKEAGYDVGTPMNAEYVFTSEDESEYGEINRFDSNYLEDDYDKEKPVWISGDDYRWGTALSGMYPFYTADGAAAGYVGVDIGLESYNETFGKLTLTFWILLIVITIMVVSLFISLALGLRNSLYRDSLTGLLNRNIYRTIISRELEKKKEGLGAFYFLDMDGFKSVNDTLGHIVGDHLLIQVAKRLVYLTNKKAVLVRIAGDEFGIFKQGFKDENELKEYGESIIKDLSQQVWNIDGNKINVSASAGCAIWKKPADTVLKLIEYADFALYIAKTQGKSKLVMFDYNDYNMMGNEQRIQNEIASIIMEKRYSHVFQPIVDAHTGEVAGYEGLTRFDDSSADKNIVTSYLKTIGKGKEIERILSYSLAEKFKIIRGGRDVFLSMNEGLEDLYKDLSYDEYKRFEKVFSGLDIIIEINEGRWAEINKVLEKAVSVRNFRHRIALDNFVSGSRCSSLIVGMNPDFIKLSPELIRDIEYSSDIQRFVSMTVRFAHKNRCEVIAIGVENRKTIEVLKKLGVDYLQGFITGKPSEKLEDVPKEIKKIITENEK